MRKHARGEHCASRMCRQHRQHSPHRSARTAPPRTCPRAQPTAA